MLRVALTILLPFLTPFVCYAVWAWFQSRKEQRLQDGQPLEWWQAWPWGKLVPAGGVLAIGTIVFLFASGEPPQEGRWVPPTVVDGEVVDGHFEPIPEPPPDD